MLSSTITIRPSRQKIKIMTVIISGVAQKITKELGGITAVIIVILMGCIWEIQRLPQASVGGNGNKINQ